MKAWVWHVYNAIDTVSNQRPTRFQAGWWRMGEVGAGQKR